MGKKNRPLSIISIAVSHNRIAMVFLIDKQPMDWEMSYVAASSPDNATKKAKHWVQWYGADVVVTENPRNTNRKGERSQQLLEAVCQAVQATKAQPIEVERHQPYPSKYEQIDALCARYPQMKAAAPRKRKYWENEPHAVTTFEALSNAEQITR